MGTTEQKQNKYLYTPRSRLGAKKKPSKTTKETGSPETVKTEEEGQKEEKDFLAMSQVHKYKQSQNEEKEKQIENNKDTENDKANTRKWKTRQD